MAACPCHAQVEVEGELTVYPAPGRMSGKISMEIGSTDMLTTYSFVNVFKQGFELPYPKTH
jgi:hypothetical protein